MKDKQAKINAFNKIIPNTLMETLEIRFTDIGADFLTATMPVNQRVHQANGILHGGATAGLIETMGSAASYIFVSGETHLIKGIEMSVNHLKSIDKGMVTATAKILHKGRTTHLWQVEVRDETDRLISLGKITNIILPKTS